MHDTVGFNLFKQGFGVALSEAQLGAAFEWNGLLALVIIGRAEKGKGARAHELYEVILGAVKESATAKAFEAAAEAKGMKGSDRLKELICIFMFAGYGGTNMLVKNTMNRVVKHEPDRLISAFLKDPEATVLESARLYPPVAGYNPFKLRENKTYTLKTGHTVESKAGQWGVLFSNAAHHDPSVFGGPSRDAEYAKKFDPTRENLDRSKHQSN